MVFRVNDEEVIVAQYTFHIAAMLMGFDGNSRQSLIGTDAPASLAMRQVKIEYHENAETRSTLFCIHICNFGYRKQVTLKSDISKFH